MLLVMDIFTGGFLWLMDARSFGVLFLLFLGISILLFVVGVGLNIRKGKRQQVNLQRTFLNLTDNQDLTPEEMGRWK